MTFYLEGIQMLRLFLGVLLAICGVLTHAEILELEGTVKAVDASARSITIERKTPKGTKTLELEVAKNAGDISGLKAGDPVSFAYNPDVDIISKIEKGMSEADRADLKELEGKWVATTLVISGNKLTKGDMQRHSRTFEFEGSKYTETIYRDGKLIVVSGQLKVSPSDKTFDMTGTVNVEGNKPFPLQMLGFYEREGDTVRLTYRKKEAGTTRPTKFGEGDEGKAWTNSFVLEKDE